MATRSEERRARATFHIFNAASLGAALRHYRQQAGLTQRELAEQAGLSRASLSALENGRTTEQLQHVLTLLHALGLHWVIEEKE